MERDAQRSTERRLATVHRAGAAPTGPVLIGFGAAG